MRILAVLTTALCFLAGSAVAEPVDYSLPDMAGKTHSLADYKGKWVIVNYWATWCPPCQEEIPDLVDFHDRHKDTDAVVLGINFEDIGAEQLSSFADSFLIRYPCCVPSRWRRLHWAPYPACRRPYIIAPDGSPVPGRWDRLPANSSTTTSKRSRSRLLTRLRLLIPSLSRQRAHW